MSSVLEHAVLGQLDKHCHEYALHRVSKNVSDGHTDIDLFMMSSQYNNKLFGP